MTPSTDEHFKSIEVEVERIMSLSDNEVHAECLAAGLDPEAVAGEMRRAFERVIAAADLALARSHLVDVLKGREDRTEIRRFLERTARDA